MIIKYILIMQSFAVTRFYYYWTIFIDALKEVKKAKHQNENSSALEEMVTKLSEEKIQSANDIDVFKRSELKLQEQLENLNNKYQDLDTEHGNNVR